MGIGFRELVIVLVIVLLLFGAKRVPSIMNDLAKGIKSFKSGLKDGDDEDGKDGKPRPPQA